MKWPKELILVRHGQSAYNELKKRKEQMSTYAQMRELYEDEWGNVSQNPAKILNGDFPSKKLKKLALQIYSELMLSWSDFDTPLTNHGHTQAFTTGKHIHEVIGKPDIIYVSPYLRTKETLKALREGSEDLKSVKAVEEERVREQEFGMLTLYNDRRLFHIFNPQQALLDSLQDYYCHRPLNGESQIDVRERAGSFLNTLVREHSGERVMVVTHHLVILAIMGKLERWNREKFIYMDHHEKPVNCGITIFKGKPNQGKEGKLMLHKYNLKLHDC